MCIRDSSSTSAKWASAASSVATSSGEAPFCGPYTAGAPLGPVSGLSTSLASTSSTDDSRASRPDRSARARSASPPPPGGTGSPSSSRNRAPSADSMPAPPSVVALPPTPNTMVRAPASSAARSSSPEPYVEAVSGAKTPAGRRCNPLASAISTTAVSPLSANAAVTSWPSGPATRTSRRSKPAATAASTVPSPPSATGSASTRRSGTTRRSPAVTRSATCTAVSEPLNLSAAMSTRRVSFTAASATLLSPCSPGPAHVRASRAAATITGGHPRRHAPTEGWEAPGSTLGKTGRPQP